jgi:DNA repair protein RadC
MESNSSKFELGSLAEVTLSYVYKGMVKDRPKITSSEDVYRIAMQVMDQNIIAMQEQFLAIYLNRSNRVIGTKVHFIGGLSSVIVDLKVIAATAVGLMASTVIICHNHPSGNLDPSEQDKRITARLKEALALFDINLVDHLIVGPDGERLSFLEQGML